jgi:hypothetical protein
MLQETSRDYDRVAKTHDLRRAWQDDGLRKIVLASLGGLTLSLIMTAQGIGSSGIQLLLLQ